MAVRIKCTKTIRENHFYSNLYIDLSMDKKELHHLMLIQVEIKISATGTKSFFTSVVIRTGIIPTLTYEDHEISFETFFVRALLLIVHTWNSSLLRTNLLWLQCTCCTVPTTSGRPYRSPLVWAYQWPSSQPLSSQLSHKDSLWA